MRLRTLLSWLLAVTLGALVGFVIKVGFALPGVLPTADIFMFILESPLGKMALKMRGGEAAVLIANVMRAFTCSVLAGVIVGAVLHKFRFPRALCYSALWVPTIDFIFGYLRVVDSSTSSSTQVATVQQNFGRVLWNDLWVYGWYFLALYVTFVVASRIIRRSTGPVQKAALSS